MGEPTPEGLNESDEFFMQINGELMGGYWAALDEAVEQTFGNPKGILAALSDSSTFDASTGIAEGDQAGGSR